MSCMGRMHSKRNQGHQSAAHKLAKHSTGPHCLYSHAEYSDSDASRRRTLHELQVCSTWNVFGGLCETLNAMNKGHVECRFDCITSQAWGGCTRSALAGTKMPCTSWQSTRQSRTASTHLQKTATSAATTSASARPVLRSFSACTPLSALACASSNIRLYRRSGANCWATWEYCLWGEDPIVNGIYLLFSPANADPMFQYLTLLWYPCDPAYHSFCCKCMHCHATTIASLQSITLLWVEGIETLTCWRNSLQSR
jgi:hypothetical protein